MERSSSRLLNETHCEPLEAQLLGQGDTLEAVVNSHPEPQSSIVILSVGRRGRRRISEMTRYRRSVGVSMLDPRLGESKAGGPLVRLVPDAERGPGDVTTLSLVTRLTTRSRWKACCVQGCPPSPRRRL
jgi:hypothetical protein